MTALSVIALIVVPILAPILALASSSVAGEGGAACPSVPAVREALEALLAPDSPRPDWIRVSEIGDRLLVEFAVVDSPRTERREIAAVPDCAQRARAAAIVMASWLGELPTASLAAPTAAASVKSPGPAVPPPPGGPAGQATASAAPPAAVALAPAAGPKDFVAASLPARRTWLGVGLGGDASGGAAAAARIDVRRIGARGGLGWALALGAASPRHVSVAAGTATWVRPTVSASGVFELRSGNFGVDGDIGPLAGLTVAWGNDYANNDRNAGLLWGLAAGARGFATGQRLRFWFDLRASRWLGTQRVWRDIQPSGTVVSAPLPASELAVTAGASISWN